MYVESESNGHIEVVFNGALLKGEEKEVDNRRYVASITKNINSFNHITITRLPNTSIASCIISIATPLDTRNASMMAKTSLSSPSTARLMR
jgi:hypothetical protein